jgi:hypothetical protein
LSLKNKRSDKCYRNLADPCVYGWSYHKSYIFSMSILHHLNMKEIIHTNAWNFEAKTSPHHHSTTKDTFLASTP